VVVKLGHEKHIRYVPWVYQIVKEGLNFKTEAPSDKENPVVILPEITGKFQVINESGEKLSSYTGNIWSGNIFGNGQNHPDESITINP